MAWGGLSYGSIGRDSKVRRRVDRGGLDPVDGLPGLHPVLRPPIALDFDKPHN